jgi:hypothetical protein
LNPPPESSTAEPLLFRSVRETIRETDTKTRIETYSHIDTKPGIHMHTHTPCDDDRNDALPHEDRERMHAITNGSDPQT